MIGRSLASAFMIGASGVRFRTRFAATPEAGTPEATKRQQRNFNYTTFCAFSFLAV
jgi:NAD(P)H-dependent flavin oxidoreductase YrpB (nitropropane dioxygenase family)